MKPDRFTAIRQVLFARGQMSITDIAAAVQASEPTVRRDLTLLEKEGVIVRTHGGARIAEQAGGEVAFETRESLRLPEKRAISEAAYELLTPGSSVFFDAGTTVLQLARLIRLRPIALNVFTNCLPLAQVLMHVDAIKVTLLGGVVRQENASVVGPLAEEALEKLRFDRVFLGMGAMGEDGAIYTVDPQEARFNALTLQRTANTTVLSDSTKFGTYLTHQVCVIGPEIGVITDNGLSADWRSRLERLGVQLQLVEPLS
ncbi:DeoR/GlpR family DNA-binding transcription regulator [Pelagibacterium sp. H642]|uniref:DeoR/GlpR family DNA-binding transcription regulator n=1 Tax=Pelagibacterium sp. H642 TaxID=1881069 RepID=UPI002814B4F5|nr:DeoR/GlpR family DNA-binding transcription regulator [Pelagibacterium sp. H642]WMT92658.1 DeoR/GlpR family DNA-binding transcription regulator [Pelagibacterium sp. H642]